MPSVSGGQEGFNAFFSRSPSAGWKGGTTRGANGVKVGSTVAKRSETSKK